MIRLPPISDHVPFTTLYRPSTQRGRDVVSRRAGILTCNPTVTGRPAVPSAELASPTGGQWHLIVVPINLAVRVRRPGSQTLVDGEFVAIVGDDVAIHSREWR